MQLVSTLGRKPHKLASETHSETPENMSFWPGGNGVVAAQAPVEAEGLTHRREWASLPLPSVPLVPLPGPWGGPENELVIRLE